MREKVWQTFLATLSSSNVKFDFHLSYYELSIYETIPSFNKQKSFVYTKPNGSTYPRSKWLNEALQLYLIWVLLKQEISFRHCLAPKISFKYCLTPKISFKYNLILRISFSISFNIWNLTFLQIKCDYHLKSKNSLQKRLHKKYHLSIVQAKFKNLDLVH